MTLLNFVPPAYQVIIGGHDFTACVAAIAPKRDALQPASPIVWSASMTLQRAANPALQPATFDDWLNPLWARGKSAVQIYFAGVLFATLRISDYFYDPDTEAAEVQLIDKLGFADYPTPAEDYKTLGFNIASSVTVGQIVRLALGRAGLDYGTIPEIAVIEVPPNKDQGSWIQWAQPYLGERGWWLWCDRNEVIQVVQYPQNQTTPRFVRAKSQFIASRIQGLEVPAEEVVVTGSVERRIYKALSESTVDYQYATIETEDGRKLRALERKQITTITQQDFSKTTRIQTYQAKGVAMAEAYPGDTSVITTDDTVEKVFGNDEGNITKVESFSGKPLGVAMPDAFAGSLAWERVAAKSLEEFFNAPLGQSVSGENDGVLRGHELTEWALFPRGPGYTLAIKNQKYESWREGDPGRTGSATDPVTGETLLDKRPKSDRFTYQIFERSRETDQAETGEGEAKTYKLGSLVLKTNRRQEGATPPGYGTLDPIYPTGEVALEGKRRFAPVGFESAHVQPHDVSAQTLQTDAECGQLAGLIGRQKQQRYRSWLVRMPLPMEYLANPAPLAVVNLHDEQFILEGDSWALDENGLQFQWIANSVGKLPTAIAEPAPDPIWLPTPGTLSIAPVANRAGYVSQPISIRLQATGGTKPYTFNATGLPPELSIAADRIVGTPTVAGTHEIEISVTDAAANSATTNCTITIAVLSKPQQPIVEVVDFAGSWAWGGDLKIDEVYDNNLPIVIAGTWSWGGNLEIDNPVAADFNTILVDSNGDVITAGGNVVVSQGRDFNAIVVDGSGNVMTSGGDVVITMHDAPYETIVVGESGNSVVTAGGNVVTTN